MKKLLQLLGLLFMAQISYGQKSNIYEFKANHNYQKMKDLKNVPSVYSVVEVVYEKEVKVGMIPILNEDYFFLNKKIKKLVKDSIYYRNELDATNKKYADFLTIKSLIADYINSPEEFNSKKSKLILAQNLANNNKLNVLLYADENNNDDVRLNFSILQIDEKGFEEHLVRVSKNIETLFAPLPISKLKFTTENLNRLRVVIKDVNQNDYIDGGYKNVESNGIVLNNKVDGITGIYGEFEELGIHYVLDKEYEDLFNKGDIIEESIADKYCLIEKGYVEGPKVLMAETTDKDLYLADFNFVNQYAYSINGRVNHVNSYQNNIVNIK